jgi:hypothetical protein
LRAATITLTGNLALSAAADLALISCSFSIRFST